MPISWAAPNPCVIVVVISIIIRAIHVVVVPIGIRWSCGYNWGCNNWCSCNNRSCSDNRRGCHNHRSGTYCPSNYIGQSTNCLNAKGMIPAMMGESHKPNAHCQCHNSQFLVHCLFLRLEVFVLHYYLLQIYYTTYLKVCKVFISIYVNNNRT